MPTSGSGAVGYWALKGQRERWGRTAVVRWGMSMSISISIFIAMFMQHEQNKNLNMK
jgi:hypothetical protein